MFYLNQFIKNLINHPFRGMLFFIATLFLVVIVQHRSYIQGLLVGDIAKSFSHSYFHVLIDGNISKDGLVFRLRKLSGVHDVVLQSTKSLENNLKELVEELDVAIPKSLLPEQYTGLKVILSEQATDRSILLIREYLARLYGESRVVMTPVQSTSKDRYQALASRYLKNRERINFWVILGISGMALILWLISFFGLIKATSRKMYLLEEYQRRKNILSKVFLTGTLAIYISVTAFFLIWLPPLLIETVGLLFFFILATMICTRKQRWVH